MFDCQWRTKKKIIQADLSERMINLSHCPMPNSICVTEDIMVANIEYMTSPGSDPHFKLKPVINSKVLPIKKTTRTSLH
jgi:hypothetical protein